jgi:hypothetical protein
MWLTTGLEGKYEYVVGLLHSSMRGRKRLQSASK